MPAVEFTLSKSLLVAIVLAPLIGAFLAGLFGRRIGRAGAHGVTILGPVNLAASLPYHASQMYSRNVQSFIEYATRDGALAVDLADPIIGPTCAVHRGTVRGKQDA